MLLIILLVVLTDITTAQNKNNGQYIIPAVIEEKWGFINEYGQWIVEPKFDYAYPCNDNSVAMAPFKLNGKWGYVDKNGKIVIEPKFGGVGDYFQMA